MAEPLGQKRVAAQETSSCGDRLTHVVVLGSTGSIGRSALDVIEHDGGKRLAAWGFSAHCRWQALAEQAAALRPRYVVAVDRSAAAELEVALRGSGVVVLAGLDGLIRMVQDAETDRVVSAIVGAVGLRGTWAALEAGKIVALANKETLVVAGPLVMDLAKSRGTRILPVDSEHSAIFQAKHCGGAGRSAPGDPHLLGRSRSGAGLASSSWT